MSDLTTEVTRVANALDDIKEAIQSKGQTPSGKCDTYADAIIRIETGTSVSDTTATEENVLQGKVFHLADGSKTEGSMSNRGAVHEEIESGTSYTIPEGYHNGEGTVSAVGGGIDISDTTITSDMVLAGGAFYMADGTKTYGMMPNNGAMNLKASPGVPAVIPEGYYNGHGILISDGVIVGEVDAKPSDVVAGKKFYGVSESGFRATLQGTMTDFGKISISETLDKNKKGISKGYLEGHHSSVGVSIDVDSQNVERTITQNGHYDIGSDMTSFIENVSLDVNVPSPPTQSKTVQPQTVEQTVYPDAGYLLSSVVVGAAAVGRKIASGTFTGANKVEHTENLDFTPSVVIAYNAVDVKYGNLIIRVSERNCTYCIGQMSAGQMLGFQVGSTASTYGSITINGNSISIVPCCPYNRTGVYDYTWIAIE